jgi:methionyl-tRNA formyltransferase
MSIVVMAYQDIGFVCLDELLALGADVAAVVTHRDDPDEEIWFRSVADRAREAGIPVLTPEDANAPEVVDRLAALAPDLLFSFYFRQVLKPPLLRLPKRGALNLHGSLLPRYRGRCPVNWVLIHGETETGVTLHYMEPKPDTGDIVDQRRVPIADDDTARTLNRKLGDAARVLLRESFPALLAGTAPRVPQDHGQATTFGGRGPEDGRMRWCRSARELANLVRAVTHPYPGAFTTWGATKLFVWTARPLGEPSDPEAGRVAAITSDGIVVGTGDGGLLLQRVQLDGATEEPATDFARRHGVRAGDVLGGDAAC